MCALGALLIILQKHDLLTGGGEDPDDSSGGPTPLMSVESISEVSLDGYLLVDPASLAALQIFQEERHPSLMGIGQSKEGFSVFGMLNRCVGAPGRRLLKLWFLRPLLDLKVRLPPRTPGKAIKESFPTCPVAADKVTRGQ